MRKGEHCLLFPAAILLVLVACPTSSVDEPHGDYAVEMRTLVESVSNYAKSVQPGFLVVSHNGQELLTADGTPAGAPDIPYINAIDGQARDDVFYGYVADDGATPAPARDAMVEMLDWAEAQGIQAIVVDHCSTCNRVDTSYAWNASRGYVSTATCRGSSTIPTYPVQPYNKNADDVFSLADAKNLLHFLDPCEYGTCPAYIWAMSVTNFDLLVIDPCFAGQSLNAAQVDMLKTKANGGKRLVLAYLNIGQADPQRSYWQSGWTPGNPAWLEDQDAVSGLYPVHYWHSQWQAILFDCLDEILAAGFDGVYLDGIETYILFD